MGKMNKDQFATLAGAVVAQLPRNLDVEVAQDWIDDPGTLRATLATALSRRPVIVDLDAWVDELDLLKVQRLEFVVTINPCLTIEQMVERGDYVYADPAHTTAIFDSLCIIRGTEPIMTEVVAFRIGHNATPAQVKRLRDRMGLKPICIQHELAVGEQLFLVKRVPNWIVNVDNVVVLGGKSCVSYINGCGESESRDLRLSPYSERHEWRDDVWFLGLGEPICRRQVALVSLRHSVL